MEKKKNPGSNNYRFAVKKALLVLAGLVVIALAVFLIEAHDYIGIYMASKNASSETLQQNSEQAMADFEDKLDTLVTPAAPGADTAPAKTESTPSAADSSGQPQSSSDENTAEDYASEIMGHYTALESLKDSYLSDFGSIVQSAKNDYAALPKDEQTTEKKLAIVMSKKGELEALEAACDSQVKSEIDAIRTLLKQSGQDASLADEIQDAYNNMKAAIKTEYVNKLYA
jgi:uncharacterized protein YneF (UPF0154 family)